MDKQEKPLFLFGINPVLEKLKASPQEVLEIMIAEGHQRAALHLIDREAKRRGLNVRYLEPKLLDRLANGQKHQGVVAKVDSYSYCLFVNLLHDLSSSQGHDLVLILDGLTDPRNFGALLRSAEGVGIRHVVIPKDRSVGVTPTVVKSSAGAVHYLKIYRVSNLRRVILALKEIGYWVVGLDVGANEGVYGRVYPEKLVVVLGAEGAGIRPLTRKECDFLVSIPMRGKIASLNVAVAGGIFLYEILRQRSSV
ncbi:MAG: 23S rRNA (guanosine(2251)-2'-O)-methyltransferase RlmB [Candidatus Binatia bacterium]